MSEKETLEEKERELEAVRWELLLSDEAISALHISIREAVERGILDSDTELASLGLKCACTYEHWHEVRRSHLPPTRSSTLFLPSQGKN